MKKLISAMLAIASIVCATSAFAATSDGLLDSSSRNDKTSFTAEAVSTSEMPGFRSGDIIKFDVSGLTTDNYLTVVSYKYGDGVELGNKTIQYVNQYEIDQTEKTIEYIVRTDAQDGIYKLSISGNDGTDMINFYYKVGNPAVSMVLEENANYDYKIIKEYKNGGVTKYVVGFVAKAVIGSSDVSFADVGVKELGFTFTTADGKTGTQKLSDEKFANIQNVAHYAETDGSIAFVYGVTIYGIPSTAEADSIVAEAYKLDR